MRSQANSESYAEPTARPALHHRAAQPDATKLGKNRVSRDTFEPDARTTTVLECQLAPPRDTRQYFTDYRRLFCMIKSISKSFVIRQFRS